MYDHEDWEEYDDEYDVECYVEIGFEYIVNCGCKVGQWIDREKYGFPLDEEDIADRKYIIDSLLEPVRHGLFSKSIMDEIFTCVKVEG